MTVLDSLPALVWLCCLSSLVCAADPLNLTSTYWRRLTSDPGVTSSPISSEEPRSYLRATRVRSRVECVLECHRYSHCSSLAFDATSGDCYLQPDLSNRTQPAHLGQVMINKDPACHTDDAPTTPNGTVEWNHTLTSLTGAVTCYDEFMKTTDDVSVTCLADGSWLSQGECARHIWTNPPKTIFPVDVPLPVVSGWTVCLEGIAINTRVTVNLLAGLTSLALHADFRKQFGGVSNTVITNYRIDGVWTAALKRLTPVSPFPMTAGLPFRINITATDSDEYQIFIDDILRVTYPQHTAVPAAAITQVGCTIGLTRLDVWCHN